MNLNLDHKQPELMDEMYCAFQDELDCVIREHTGTFSLYSMTWHLQYPADWIPINIMERVGKIVCRAKTRIFLGQELCKNCCWCRILFSLSTYLQLETAHIATSPWALRTVQSQWEHLFDYCYPNSFVRKRVYLSWCPTWWIWLSQCCRLHVSRMA